MSARSRGVWRVAAVAGLAVALCAGENDGRGPVPDPAGVPVVASVDGLPEMTVPGATSWLAGGYGWMVPYIGYEPVVEVEPPSAPSYGGGVVVAAEHLESSWPAQLSRDDLERVYDLAGVPVEWRAEASAVACGHANARFPSGESNCRPMAVGDAGNSLGLFQLNAGTWAPYCGVAADELFDPVINARCAVSILRYEERRGYDRWSNWTVKPW